MSHLRYYDYQATARGVSDAQDVQRLALDQEHCFRLALRWLDGIGREARIVDLACGHGSFLWWLQRSGFRHAFGVDSSLPQIEICRLAGLDVAHQDAFTWLAAQPEASLDAITALDFIEHISKDDFMTLLEQSARCLKPGGLLILRYPNGDSPLVGLNLFNDITHVWTYTTNCLSTLGRMHGFETVGFVDQGIESIRDLRWLKVPLARLALTILRTVVRAATKEDVRYWNSSIWSCLRATGARPQGRGR